MKKLSLLLLVSVFAFWGCSNDDEPKNEVVVSFEKQLTEAESEFIASGTPNNQSFQKEAFSDPEKQISFDHYYADWGGGYSFAGFTYMNKTDNQTANSPAPISGKAYSGKVYIAVDSSDGTYGTPAIMTIQKSGYAIKGAWITNSTYAYKSMTNGDGYARKFTKGDWYKVTAIGYDETNKEIGSVEILLANYTTNTDTPISKWMWFDLTSLQNAVKIKFIPSSSDTGTFGMNTPAYFCLDDITLIEK